jgi:hypothetical protein
MVYELRIYSVTPGRMADLHNRFQHYLPPLFARHGVACVGRWAVVSGPRTPAFIYLMRYKDYAEREACWASFYSDPEWWSVRVETNAGEEMVESFDLIFMKPNPAWDDTAASSGAPVGGIHELIVQHVALGQAAATNDHLTQSYLPALREAGAKVLGVFDVASGCNLPQVVTVLAWKDANARHAGWQSIATHEGLRDEIKLQRNGIGCALLQRADVYLLEPVPYALAAASVASGG